MNIRDGKIRIHTSDRNAFRRCRRKAYHSSKLWLGLQPVRPNSTLWLGTGVHKAVEMYYGYSENPVNVFNRWAEEGMARIKKTEGLLVTEKEKFDEMIELGTGMLWHYMKFAKEHDDFNVYVFPDGRPAVEVFFEVPILDPQGNHLYANFNTEQPGMTEEQLAFLYAYGYVLIPVYYGGRIDLIVQDIYGDLWIYDHKTCKSFGDWSKLTLDTQCGSYIWAVEQLLPPGLHVRGVMYNGIKKTLPREPELLKNGKSLSVAKNISTTYEVYLAAVLSHGFDPADYSDILQHLKDQDEIKDDEITTKFFKRKKVKRSREEIQSIGRDIYQEAVDMICAESFYPNPTRDCSWDCDFYEVCRGLNNQEDTEWMLTSLYEPRSEEEDATSAWAGDQ